MNDDDLRQLLKQADERFQTAKSLGGPLSVDRASFIDSVRRSRQRQVRQRTTLGVSAVFFIAGGIWAWGLNGSLRSGTDHLTNMTNQRASDAQGKTTDAQVARPKLNDEDIARLKAEIAALEAEANQAQRFVELYRAAEGRRKILVVGEPAAIEPLLPPEVIAELEVDRAAAITVVSADAQVDFDRPDDAIESYRAVLRNFPESRWASVAQQRLVQINHMN